MTETSVLREGVGLRRRQSEWGRRELDGGPTPIRSLSSCHSSCSVKEFSAFSPGMSGVGGMFSITALVPLGPHDGGEELVRTTVLSRSSLGWSSRCSAEVHDTRVANGLVGPLSCSSSTTESRTSEDEDEEGRREDMGGTVLQCSEGRASAITEEERAEERAVAREVVLEDAVGRKEARVVLGPLPSAFFVNAHLEERVDSGLLNFPLESSVGGTRETVEDAVPESRSTVVVVHLSTPPHVGLLTRAPSRSIFLSSLHASEEAEPATDGEEEEEEEDASEKREVLPLVLAREADDRSSN